MKQNITTPLVHSIVGAGRLFRGPEVSEKAARAAVYRAAKRGDLEIVKVGLRSSAVTRASIDAYAKKCGIPLPASI